MPWCSLILAFMETHVFMDAEKIDFTDLAVTTALPEMLKMCFSCEKTSQVLVLFCFVFLVGFFFSFGLLLPFTNSPFCAACVFSHASFFIIHIMTSLCAFLAAVELSCLA